MITTQNDAQLHVDLTAVLTTTSWVNEGNRVGKLHGHTNGGEAALRGSIGQQQ